MNGAPPAGVLGGKWEKRKKNRAVKKKREADSMIRGIEKNPDILETEEEEEEEKEVNSK